MRSPPSQRNRCQLWSRIAGDHPSELHLEQHLSERGLSSSSSKPEVACCYKHLIGHGVLQ